MLRFSGKILSGLVNMNGLPDQFPLTIYFFQHPDFIRVSFDAIFGNGFFLMADPGIIGMDAELVVAIAGAAAITHFRSRIDHGCRRNVQERSVTCRDQDFAVRLNMPATGMAFEVAGAPGGGFFFQEFYDGGGFVHFWLAGGQ